MGTARRRRGHSSIIFCHVARSSYRTRDAADASALTLRRRAALDCDGRHCRERDRHRAPGAPVRVSPTGFCPPRSVGTRVFKRRVGRVHALLGEPGCGVRRRGGFHRDPLCTSLDAVQLPHGLDVHHASRCHIFFWSLW